MQGLAVLVRDMRLMFMQNYVLLLFPPTEGNTALFSRAAVFSGFNAFQWCSPKDITHESGSWNLPQGAV